MELFPVRAVAGFPEILWSFRQSWKKRKSGLWIRVAGVVEGYELLLSGNDGWLVVLYSYSLKEECFSGEWRKWIHLRRPSYEAQTSEITSRLPRGTKIVVRVDPQHPATSVAEL